MIVTTSFSKIRALGEKSGIATEPFSLRYFVVYKRNYFFFKRISDIIISLAVIVFFLSWFLPLAALLIKLDSPGPVLFVQRRVGRWGPLPRDDAVLRFMDGTGCARQHRRKAVARR